MSQAHTFIERSRSSSLLIDEEETPGYDFVSNCFWKFEPWDECVYLKPFHMLRPDPHPSPVSSGD
jgi:hypothetical protein